VAILRRKPRSSASGRPTTSSYLIASRVKSNIRELEARLTRMIAFCALRAGRCRWTSPRKCWASSGVRQRRSITIEPDPAQVGEAYGVKLSDLKAKTARGGGLPASDRDVLARQLTHASLSESGRAFRQGPHDRAARGG